MAAAAGALLALLAGAALLINLYFAALACGRWPGLQRALGRLLTACGADTSSCAVVVATPYARLVGGAPNVVVGIPWCLALLGLGGYWMASGRLVVPWPYLVAAAGSLAVGGYLIYALVVVLKQPCPL